MAKRTKQAEWEVKEQRSEYRPTAGWQRETRGKGDKALFAKFEAKYYGYVVVKKFDDGSADEVVEKGLTGTAASDRASALYRAAGFPDEYYFTPEYQGPID